MCFETQYIHKTLDIDWYFSNCLFFLRPNFSKYSAKTSVSYKYVLLKEGVISCLCSEISKYLEILIKLISVTCFHVFILWICSFRILKMEMILSQTAVVIEIKGTATLG